MRAIREEIGELLSDPKISVIIHQCKTTNKFDSGFASAIKRVFPKAWEADCEATRLGKNVLGGYSYAKVGPNKYVFNLYSYSTVDYNKRYTDYDAMRVGLEKIKWNLVNLLDTPSIGLGHIGCSTVSGNGDWNIVRRIVSEVFNDYQGDIKFVDTPGA